MNGYSPGRKVSFVVVVAVLALVIWAGVAGAMTGVSVDNDSLALQDSFRSIASGTYHASRTSGFPAYEYFGAIIWPTAGVKGVMLASIALVLAALLILITPIKARKSWLGLACWSLFALSPAVLTNASAVMETPLLILLLSVVALILASGRLRPKTRDGALALVSLLLVLTRPDAILFVSGTAIAFLFLGESWSRRLRSVISLGAGALVAVAVLVWLTGKFPFQASYLVEEPLVRRGLRGAVGFNTALSPLGVLALVILLATLVYTAVLLIRKRKRSAPVTRVIRPLSGRAFTVAWVLSLATLYGARFIFLADEVEYLVPLILAIAVATPNLAWAGKKVWIPGLVVIASTAITSLATVSLLQRIDPWQPNPSVRVSVQPGGFIQDLNAREASMVRSSSGYQAFLTESEGSLAKGIQDGSIALVPRDTWNYLTSLAYGDYYSKSTFVAACEGMTSDTLIPGWRVSQPSAEYGDIDAFKTGKQLQCDIVASIQPDSVTPNQLGATRLAPAGVPIPR